jgi:hypothetical protein
MCTVMGAKTLANQNADTTIHHMWNILSTNQNAERKSLLSKVLAIDILYTLDSASDYSAIQKLKPWLQSQVVPMKWEVRMFSIS